MSIVSSCGVEWLARRPQDLFTFRKTAISTFQARASSRSMPGRVRAGQPAQGQQRESIKPGSRVQIELKADQRTGRLTEGIIARLLTNSSTHPHGIKVMLQDGRVGRVKTILGAPKPQGLASGHQQKPAAETTAINSTAAVGAGEEPKQKGYS